MPPDIAVKGVKKVANDFHARYNACGKTYAYYISNSRFRDPFLSRYSWQIERPLDLEKINRFCEQITGEHDFYAFSSSGRSVEDTVRCVSLCRAERQGDMIILKITANGFSLQYGENNCRNGGCNIRRAMSVTVGKSHI